MNIISRLAAFIRDTIISWTGASFLRDGPGEDDGHQEHLYMALAVSAVVASHFITGADAPQRALFRVPACAANLLLRAHTYWKGLNAMVHNAPPPEEPARPPAFEVDSSIATTLRGAEATGSGVAGGVQKVNVIYFSSNSTANPEAYTRATVENQMTANPEVVHSLAEQAHARTMAKLMRESGLSGLHNCETLETKTKEQSRGTEISHTHLNTKCDATARQGPLPAPVPVLPSRADELPLRADEPTPPLRADEPPPQANDAAQRYDYNYANVGGAAALATGGVLPALTRALKTPAGLIVVTGTVFVGTGTVIFGVSTWIYKRLQSWLLPRSAGDEAAPSAEEPLAEASSAEALKDDRQHHPTKAETKLAGIMQSAGTLDKARDPASFKKEEIIAAVGITLFAPNPEFMYDVTRLDKRLEDVAKMILQAEKLYHGRADEKISAGRAGMVVRNWLFDNVLGMPVESWLARSVAVIKSPGDVNALLMQNLLTLDALRSDGIIDTKGLSEGKKWQFEKFWDYAVDNTLPFTNFLAADGGASLTMMDDSFAWLHTGSLLLKDAGATLSDFSVAECKAVGKALLQRVEAGDMDISYLRYLALPALLFEAVNHSERVSRRKKGTLAHRLKAVSEYAEYCTTIAAAHTNLQKKVNRVKKASTNWEPRGAIADRYVGQCSDAALIKLGYRVKSDEYEPGSLLPPLGPLFMSNEQLLERGKLFAKDDYLMGQTPPGCPDVKVTAEYERKTQKLAKTFSAVDYYMLAAAMGRLEEKELQFINLKGAVITRVLPSLYSALPGRASSKQLKNTDLFSVIVDGEERIYAFVRKRGSEYDIRRVDRHIPDYIRSGLFDISKDADIREDEDGRVMLPRYTNGPLLWYSLRFPLLPTAIDGEGMGSGNIINHFKEKHRSELYERTLMAGYDKTPEQKAFEFLMHLFPFYDCVNEKFPNNIISCVMDLVTVIPVVGSSVNLTWKFGFSLYRAAKMGIKLLPSAAMSPKILNTVGRPVLAQISLPTIPELAVLSKATIRALDPGFELITAVGKYSGAGLKTLFNKLRVGGSAKDKIKLNKILTKALKKIEKPGATEQVISHEALLTETANLPGTNIKVPVNIVGEAGGKNYYAIVDPETMEFLEEIYLIEKGELKLVRQRPDNWSPKNDISDHKLALPRKEEKKVDAAAGPSKKKATTSLCPADGRIKRGIDDLCQAKPFEGKGEDTPFKIIDDDVIAPSAYRMPLLMEVNSVRYEILQHCLDNIYRIGLKAERVIKKMDLSQIRSSFQFHTNIKLVNDEQTKILEKNVLATIDACSFFWAKDQSHIVFASLLEESTVSETVAVFLHNEQAMLISDSAYRRKNQALLEMAILHESGHAARIEIKDYGYLPDCVRLKCGVSSILNESQKKGMDEMSYYIQYLKSKTSSKGFERMIAGADLKEKFGIDITEQVSISDPRITAGMAKLGITYADLMIENADILALFIMSIGHDLIENNWRSVKDLFQQAESQMSFSDSVARARRKADAVPPYQ
ncbi:conserved uncharacterized protein [Erwinia sp. Ejp617]|nr:hypothetical protein [Erwinia sp. Ejp617]ADP10437.1 conserved uncharacterized protein [Erwinia sp. Ejp617]